MSEPTCINLEERFGRAYRVTWEADGATRYQWPEAERPWLMEIRGRHGIVYPKGGEILQAMTTHRRIAGKLRALPCALSARGDLETVITFHVDDAPTVFGLIKPHRRRQVSDAERERLAVLRARTGIGVQRPTQGDFPGRRIDDHARKRAADVSTHASERARKLVHRWRDRVRVPDVRVV